MERKWGRGSGNGDAPRINIATARKIITKGYPRNDPTLRAGLPTLRAWARPREGHGKGKLIRILFSVYFGGFRG